jgi:hypothetical protein
MSWTPASLLRVLGLSGNNHQLEQRKVPLEQNFRAGAGQLDIHKERERAELVCHRPHQNRSASRPGRLWKHRCRNAWAAATSSGPPANRAMYRPLITMPNTSFDGSAIAPR